MANYEATSRSNYFRIKDYETFEAWAKKLDLIILTGREEEGLVGVAPHHLSDDGDWPSMRYDGETDELEDIDFVDELAGHLADGEVAVLMSVGHEKLRYVYGSAVAMTNAGVVWQMSLNDIYDKLRDAGLTFTYAEL